MTIPCVKTPVLHTANESRVQNAVFYIRQQKQTKGIAAGKNGGRLLQNKHCGRLSRNAALALDCCLFVPVTNQGYFPDVCMDGLYSSSKP